jgi:hypothetical protein
MIAMPYETHHFPASFTHPSGRAFVRRALVYYAMRAAKRRVKGMFSPSAVAWRDAATVRQAYDVERGYTLDRINELEFADLVYGSHDRLEAPDASDFVLIGDDVRWESTRTTRRFLVEHMERRIREVTRPGGRLIEFGSGNGRNLLYLKSRLPDREFAGLELSSVSVELARRLSDRFGYTVQVEAGNACAPTLPPLPGPTDAVFSCHALEMMPRSFVTAVDHMLRIATDRVLFFEPIPELWPSNARGWASHCRAYVMDRLRGFMQVVHARAASAGWRVETAERLKTSTNPINETVEVTLVRARP